MNDFVEFLRARLDEDEDDARATAWNASTQIHNEWEAAPPAEGDGPWRIRQKGEIFILLNCEGEEMVRHIARHDPERVLREVKAKRGIVDRYAWLREHGDTGGAEWVLRFLAIPYSSHPDYRQEWAPTY